MSVPEDQRPTPANALTARERHAMLDAIAQAVAQEAHIITQRPRLLFQQVYNRLQWAGEPMASFVEEQRARRASTGAAPWVRNVTPPSESRGLIRTLASDGSNSIPMSLAFSPDGATLLTSGQNGSVTLWDVASGQKLLTLRGATKLLTRAVISPDGAVIVTAGEDWVGEVSMSAATQSVNLLKLWDAATGDERATLGGHAGWISAAVFSPDGRVLASASHDGAIRLWDVATAAALLVIAADGLNAASLREVGVSGMASIFSALAWSPDGASLAAFGARSDAQAPTMFHTSIPLHTLSVFDAATGDNRGAIAWEVATHNGQIERVTGFGYSADGATIYAEMRGAGMLAWNARTLERLPAPPAEAARRAVHRGEYSPDGALRAQIIPSGRLEVIEVASGARRALYYGHAMGVRAVTWNPDGASIATAGGEGTVKLWRAPTLEPAGERSTPPTDEGDGAMSEGHRDAIWAMDWSPDGATIATGSADHTARLWNAETRQSQVTLTFSDTITACAYSPDGELLALLPQSQSVRLAQPASGLAPIALSDPASGANAMTAFAWSPDGLAIATVDRSSVIRLWDMAGFDARAAQSPPIRATLSASDDVGLTDVRWSPDGRRIAASGSVMSQPNTRCVMLWDVDTGALLFSASFQGFLPWPLAFSPDAATFATQLDGLQIGLWDARTGVERGWLAFDAPPPDEPPITALGVNPQSITLIGWSRDGRDLITAQPGAIVIWDAQTLRQRLRLPMRDVDVTSGVFTTAPDGATLLVSSFYERALTLWDLTTGAQRATAIFPFGQGRLSTHPWLPRIVTADQLGAVTFLDLEGLSYGPLVVVAHEHGDGASARCPVCRGDFTVATEQLGAELTCPQAGCDAHLRLAAFALRSRSGLFQGASAAPPDASQIETLTADLAPQTASQTAQSDSQAAPPASPAPPIPEATDAPGRTTWRGKLRLGSLLRRAPRAQ